MLMAHGRFAPQAWASIVYSAAPILGAIVFALLGFEGRADGFAWGTLVGAILGQWAIPAIALRKLPAAVGRIRIGALRSRLPRVPLARAAADAWAGSDDRRRVVRKVDRRSIAPGAIAAITFARKLMMAPVGVVGQAVGAALLPILTALHQERTEPRLSRS